MRRRTFNSLAKLSVEEADFLWGLDSDATLRRLIEEYDCDLAFCTLGAQGARAANRHGIVCGAAPFDVRVVDTTGAGDIFMGAALSRLLTAEREISSLSLDELSEIVDFACSMASLSTTRPGGMTSIPDPATCQRPSKYNA